MAAFPEGWARHRLTTAHELQGRGQGGKRRRAAGGCLCATTTNGRALTASFGAQGAGGRVTATGCTRDAE